MTPAQDIPLTLEGVLANARPSLQKKIIYSIDLIRKSEPMALRLDPVDGFRWWISGKSFAQFHADEFQQQKINFEQ